MADIAPFLVYCFVLFVAALVLVPVVIVPRLRFRKTRRQIRRPPEP